MISFQQSWNGKNNGEGGHMSGYHCQFPGFNIVLHLHKLNHWAVGWRVHQPLSLQLQGILSESIVTLKCKDKKTLQSLKSLKNTYWSVKQDKLYLYIHFYV